MSLGSWLVANICYLIWSEKSYAGGIQVSYLQGKRQLRFPVVHTHKPKLSVFQRKQGKQKREKKQSNEFPLLHCSCVNLTGTRYVCCLNLSKECKLYYD